MLKTNNNTKYINMKTTKTHNKQQHDNTRNTNTYKTENNIKQTIATQHMNNTH